MSTSRRRYSAQFKDEAVQMVVQTGQPIAQVARDLRVNEGTLGNWVHLWKLDHPDPEPEVTVFDREKMGLSRHECGFGAGVRTMNALGCLG